MAGVDVKWKDEHKRPGHAPEGDRPPRPRSSRCSARRTGRPHRRTRSASTTIFVSARTNAVEALVLRLVRRPVQPQVEQPQRSMAAQSSPPMFMDFVPGWPETPVNVSPAECRARPWHVGRTSMGRGLVGAQVRHLLWHDQPATAHRAELHARLCHGWRRVQQGVVQSLRASCRVRVRLSLRAGRRARRTTGESVARR